MIGLKKPSLEDTRGWDDLVTAGRVEPPRADVLLAANDAVQAAVQAAAITSEAQGSMIAGTTRLAATSPSSHREATAPPPRRAARSRPRRRLAIAGGLTLAAAVALVVAPLPFGSGSQPASAEAVSILTDAAAAAHSAPAIPARADQFVFVKSLTASASISPSGASVTVTPQIRSIWLSADGTRPGLLTTTDRSGDGAQSIALSGCLNGVTVAGPSTGTGKEASGDEPCTTIPAYRSTLPTDVKGMRAYLYAHSDGGNPRDQQAFISAGDLIRESYLPPDALAAVFGAVATIPGVTVAHDATDAAGRHGVAVARTFNGTSSQLIFNPTTHTFLGEREVAVSSDSGLPDGTVLNSTARTQIAVVDRTGQLPAGGGGQ